MHDPHHPQAAISRARLVLRDYQHEAIAAIDTAHERALLVAACGTGKTLMAAHGAAKLLDGQAGTVLVLFPTLGLLEQTHRVWRAEAPFTFEPLAVCSQPIRGSEDIALTDLPLHNTTAADELADWLATTPGVRVVFATYQSVPVLVSAHAQHAVAPWTVLVCDEAHRTAGKRGKPFGAVLHQRRIPACHRLFFTATPKIHHGAPTSARRSTRRSVASMDDPNLYGPRVFSLPARDAIDRDILSPFKLAVIAVSDSAVSSAIKDLRLINLAAGEQGAARADHVAGAIALTQAAADYQLSSVLAFHNTIAASEEFCQTFLRTHRLLAAKNLIRDGRAATVTHIDGRAPLHERLDAAAILADRDPRQWNVVTNARCFTEGIDIPALDAVYFAEPRASEVDVAQAIGRAIRKNPHHDRPALVILAVTVDDSQDAETIIDLSNFQRVRQVLTALASHDPSITKDLARLRETLPDTKPDPGGAIDTDLIDIHLPAELPPHLSEQFLRAFSIHTVDQLTRQWEEAFAALVDYTAQHGHASPPQQYRTERGMPLGQWVSGQRRAHARGRLAADRADRLQELTGWAWNAFDARWEASFAALAAYADTHGHSYPPRGFISADGINLNHWVIGLRRPGQRAKLDAARRARLEALPGWSWELRKPTWDAHFAALVDYVAEHGHANPPRDHRSPAGTPVGRWVYQMRARRTQLSNARRARLEDLPGWSWDYQTRSAWQDALTELQDYAGVHGHACPPQRYRSPSGYALGEWVSRQRRDHRRATLSADRARTLQALPGWAWTAADARWEQNFAALADYARRHHHTQLPADYRSPTGVNIAQWARATRRTYHNNELSEDRRARLEVLPGWSWDNPPRRQSPPNRTNDHTWQRAFNELAAYAAAHGHAHPLQDTHTETGLALGHWVSAQRQAHRNGRITPERMTQLESLPGWLWSHFDALWENGLDELRRYSLRTGQANPPKRYVSETGFKLGSWTQDQRRKYRSGQLGDERRARLDALPGFSTVPDRDTAWEANFGALTDYVQRHGHARPTTDYITDDRITLGRWVITQRNAYRSGAMARTQPDRVRRLEQLPGWAWHAANADWDKGFEALRAYAAQTGSTQPPHRYITESGYPLWRWVRQQQENHQKQTLTPDRRARLESLPGWRWT